MTHFAATARRRNAQQARYRCTAAVLDSNVGDLHTTKSMYRICFIKSCKKLHIFRKK